MQIIRYKPTRTVLCRSQIRPRPLGAPSKGHAAPGVWNRSSKLARRRRGRIYSTFSSPTVARARGSSDHSPRSLGQRKDGTRSRGDRERRAVLGIAARSQINAVLPVFTDLIVTGRYLRENTGDCSLREYFATPCQLYEQALTETITACRRSGQQDWPTTICRCFVDSALSAVVMQRYPPFTRSTRTREKIASLRSRPNSPSPNAWQQAGLSLLAQGSARR